MKRLNFLFGAAALIAVSLTATPALNAQENGNRDENGKVVRGPYETNRFGDNWFIGAGGGINILLNEGYDIRISPSIDANLGKWFTPAVGMRIGYQGFQTGAWSDQATALAPVLDTEQGQYLTKLGYMYFHGDFLWNMSDALGGYKETRFWNLVPYAHAGFFRTYGLDNSTYANNEIAAGAGLLHNLRLVERLDLVIDMRATLVNGRVIQSDGVAILPSVTAGLAVDLGWPAFTRTSTIVAAVEAANEERAAILETAMAAMEVANAALEVENAGLAKENSALKKQVNTLKNQPKMDYTTFFDEMGPATLYFNIGQAVLNEKELAHLDFLAKNLIEKVDKNTKIYLTVMGSADGNTGGAKRNQQLSEARGKYVFDILTTKYGIAKERLIVKSEVVKKAAKPELSRAVVISF
ncbi:MAG: OmpA family protein [Bacteroidales bacterium]|nr:OmpA family protein [Bacteroidales bacterium]